MSDPTPQCDSNVHDGRRTCPKAGYKVYYRKSAVVRLYCRECWKDLEGCFGHRHVEVEKV